MSSDKNGKHLNVTGLACSNFCHARPKFGANSLPTVEFDSGIPSPQKALDFIFQVIKSTDYYTLGFIHISTKM